MSKLQGGFAPAIPGSNALEQTESGTGRQETAPAVRTRGSAQVASLRCLILGTSAFAYSRIYTATVATRRSGSYGGPELSMAISTPSSRSAPPLPSPKCPTLGMSLGAQFRIMFPAALVALSIDSRPGVNRMAKSLMTALPQDDTPA